LLSQHTYPSWQPKIQFDYIMVAKSEFGGMVSPDFKAIKSINLKISDHIPIGVEIQI